MSGLEPLIPFAWGALRLTSSLLTAGFKKLVGVEDESNGLIEWTGDVVLKARDKSQLTNQQGRGGGDAAMRAVEQYGHEVRRDLASMRASVEQCRAENMQFFSNFMSSIEASQHGLDVLRNGPLEEAQMSLKEFEASGDDLDELKEASRKARTALVTGSTLEIKFTAATITISAGYVHKIKAGSPSEAKQATVKGSLANVVQHFATIWADPLRAGTVEERKVLSFLLNVVSCVCVLPPEDVLVLPELDCRLFSAFGALCASEPQLRRLYPHVGGAAVKAMLEEKTMQSLFELATEVGADVTACTSKDGVVEILLTSQRDLVPTQATACKGMVEEVVWTPPPSGNGPAPASPLGSTSTDIAALMALYLQTNGPPEKEGRLWTAAQGGWRNRRGWGMSVPRGDWHGVTVHGRGRVIELKLSGNDLRGPIPPALGGLAALRLLRLDENELSGAIPPELGRLTALTWLNLGENNLSGPIPSALGGLTALQTLYLDQNQLSGALPPELGGLTALRVLDLSINNITGPIPSALGGLTALQQLGLNNNKLDVPSSAGEDTGGAALLGEFIAGEEGTEGG